MIKDQTLVGILFEKIHTIEQERGLPCKVNLPVFLKYINNKDGAMKLLKAMAIPCYKTRIEGTKLIIEDSPILEENFKMDDE